MYKGKVILKLLVIYLCLGVILAFALFPIAWMVLTSLKSETEVLKFPVSWLPSHLNWSCYKEMWAMYPVRYYLVNSFIVSLGTMILTIVLASPASYAFSRSKSKTLRKFLFFILVVQMFPTTLTVIPYFFLMRRLGILNTYVALILADVTFSLPLTTWLLTGYFASIPRDIEDASQVDGCSRFQTLRFIVFPLAIPGIAAIMMFTFMVAWGEFLFAYILTKTVQMHVVTVGIATLIGERMINWSMMMSIGVTCLLPVLVLFFFFEKHLVSGLTRGAVKG